MNRKLSDLLISTLVILGIGAFFTLDLFLNKEIIVIIISIICFIVAILLKVWQKTNLRNCDIEKKVTDYINLSDAIKEDFSLLKKIEFKTHLPPDQVIAIMRSNIDRDSNGGYKITIHNNEICVKGDPVSLAREEKLYLGCWKKPWVWLGMIELLTKVLLSTGGSRIILRFRLRKDSKISFLVVGAILLSFFLFLFNLPYPDPQSKEYSLSLVVIFLVSILIISMAASNRIRKQDKASFLRLFGDLSKTIPF